LNEVVLTGLKDTLIQYITEPNLNVIKIRCHKIW